MNKKIFYLSLITAQTLFAESLSVITVDGNQDKDSTSISATKINKTQIDNSVVGNGFISSLLETNPNINVTDDSNNSETAGEITPGKISINEAPYYQNNVIIDGVGNNSLIDPNLSNPFDFYDVPGNENETFIDLDLIKEIYVYDSNISAEYGDFTGGVIDAKLIRPKATPSVKFSYKHTSDKFTKLHVENEESFAEADNLNKQPRFEKHFYNFNVSTPITENNGVIFSYSRKESTIPAAHFGGYKDTKRLNQNFLLRGSHYFDDDSTLDITGTYSPYESTYIQKYIKDSETKVKGGGYSLRVNYEKDLDFWHVDTNLALKSSENTKKSANYLKKWNYSNDKNWGVPNDNGIKEYSNEGGYGNIEKTQNGVAYNLKLTSQEFDTNEISHKIKTGTSLKFNNARYKRAEDSYIYLDPTFQNVNCNGDTEGCEENEQYFKERRVYQAEDTDVNMFSTSAYVEDRLKYKNLEVTPGLRVDYNTYLKNTDLAYRLNSSYKPFGNNKTVIYGGVNRYYGKSFLGYKLREARLPHYDEYRSTAGVTLPAWDTSADKDSQKYIFSDLKTPYTDEQSLGLKQEVLSMLFNVKHVHRDSKNKFVKQRGDYKVYTTPNGSKGYYKPAYFTNNGYSESDITSLSIGNAKPVDLGFANLGYSFSTSWTKHFSNSVSYDDLLEEDDSSETDKVYYNGSFVDRGSLTNNDKPDVYNMHLNFAFKPLTIFGTKCRINLNNIIKYKSSYSEIKATTGEKTYVENLPGGSTKNHIVPIYRSFDFKDAVTVNTKASFNFKLRKKESLLISTEITNLFDEVQNIESTSNKYKTGRQFWFNIAYKY